MGRQSAASYISGLLVESPGFVRLHINRGHASYNQAQKGLFFWSGGGGVEGGMVDTKNPPA